MASLVEELVTILIEEEALYSKLNEYGEQKVQILIDADIPALEKLTALEAKITKAQNAADANTTAIATINGDENTEGSFAKAIADAKKAIDTTVSAAKDQADKGVADAAAAQSTANQNAENITAISDAVKWGSF